MTTLLCQFELRSFVLYTSMLTLCGIYLQRLSFVEMMTDYSSSLVLAVYTVSLFLHSDVTAVAQPHPSLLITFSSFTQNVDVKAAIEYGELDIASQHAYDKST